MYVLKFVGSYVNTPVSALKSPVVTVGMQPSSCPTAKTLEDMFYPNLTTLTDSIAKLVTGEEDHGIPLPDEHSMADVYKRFKGPFSTSTELMR